MAYEWFNTSPAYDPLSAFAPSKPKETAGSAPTSNFTYGSGNPLYTTPPDRNIITNPTSNFTYGQGNPFDPTFVVPDSTVPRVVGGTGRDNDGGGDDGGGGGGGGGGGDNTDTVSDYTNQIYILIAKLKSVGIPASTADRAGAFFTALFDDGITGLDNAVDIFLYSKSYVSKKSGLTIDSPYYQDFGKFNDKLSSAKPPGVLVPWILGIKDTLNKYKPGSLFESDDSIQQYLQNDVKVSQLDERLNAYKLEAINADPSYVKALQAGGFINSADDLIGFYANPKLGTEQLQLNRNTGRFAAEAIRRAKEGGVQADIAFATKQAAALKAKGYSEGQISATAEQGYNFIARNIMPEVKISGIYQGKNAASASTVQSELQQQEFMAMDSERFDILRKQELGAFKSSSGNIRSPSISSYRDNLTGQL